MTGYEVRYLLCTYFTLIYFYDTIQYNVAIFLDAHAGEKYLTYGLNWVHDYFSYYRGYEIRNDEWTKECCFENTPTQKGNGTECGVILLATVDYLSTDRVLNFTMQDMECYRKFICLHILSHA